MLSIQNTDKLEFQLVFKIKKAVNAKMRNSKKAAPIRQANPEIPGLNKNGNWMDILNNLLPYLTLGAGAYYLGRRN